MVTIDDAVIARLKSHGEKFEVLVDPVKARKIKQGDDETEFLASNYIYKDVGSAEKVPSEDLEKIFGTDSIEEIAIRIIRKGDLQLTAEQRKEIFEEKKRKIISHISKNAVDPKTGYPHPSSRVEAAMEKANIHIDLFKSTEKQIDEIVKKIRVHLPLRFEKRTMAIKIPSNYTGKAYGVLSNYGQLLKEEWGNDGTLYVKMEIPAGMQPEFFEKLNAITKGDVEVKIIDKR
ncbi:MAG TPA: ribosome assembly factor SBDS [Candidatus Methanofastidiosa archaeon]|nr:ribosome assembly factor SBDS [Candidatus Methanofastidiosa archaeon]